MDKKEGKMSNLSIFYRKKATRLLTSDFYLRFDLLNFC